MAECKVYAGSLLEEIVRSGREPTAALGRAKGERRRGPRRPDARMRRGRADQVEDRKMLRNKAYWEIVEARQRKEAQEIKEKLENEAALNEAKFQNMYKSIMEGESFTKDIDKMLHLHDQMEKRKAQARYNEWNENVFMKIQGSISESMAMRDPDDAASLRRREYESFLKATRDKESLFLDIIIESDYDPFVLSRASVKYDAKDLDDPTKRMLSRTLVENSLLVGRQPKRGEEPAPRSDKLDVKMWGKGKIESTPHGHFAKMMSATSKRKETLLTSNAQETQFRLDHFTFPVGREAIDSEFPLGKRTDFGHLPWRAGAAL